MTPMQHSKSEKGLANLIDILWQRKQLVLWGTLICSLVGLALTMLFPRIYLSLATISLDNINRADQDTPSKGMAIPDYRVFSRLYQNRRLLDMYSQTSGFRGDWHFNTAQNDTDFFINQVKPIYAYDIEKQKISQEHNSIVGLHITTEGSSPKDSVEKAEIMGGFILTTMLNMQIRDYLSNLTIQAQSAIVTSEKKSILENQEISYLKEKERLIEKQFLASRELSQKTDRELVNANAATEKYLSPQQQLVSVKMSIKESQIQIDRYQRISRQNQIIMDFIDHIGPLLEDDSRLLVNSDLLESLIKEKDAFFSDQNNEDWKLAASVFTEPFLHFSRRKLIDYKFISEPSLPDKHYKPKRKRIVIGIFFLSFFFFSLLAFSREIWQLNRDGAADDRQDK